ncbi:MAG: hypothetical protein PWR17_108 [Candidatus Methanomethylophilaceae archaeon]|nr:hypothetical protein [Candidatus Methanomethylophilaceae archaeon]
MTSYDKSGHRRRKRSLIPIMTILICLFAMIAVGYSALISDVRNEVNLIAAEGLDAKILNENGEIMRNGEFSQNANGGYGATKIDYGYSSTDSNPPTFFVSCQELELGRAVISIEPSVNSDVKYVIIWYDVVWTGTDPESLYGMDTFLTIGQGETAFSLAEGEKTAPMNISVDNSRLITLNGYIPEDISGMVDEPSNIFYTITVYVEPYLF